MSEEIWVKIQRKTFARWVDTVISSSSEGLKCSDNLEEDLKDGVILHTVLSVCSGKVLPKINPKPKIQIQKIENVGKCLKWMQQQGIKLVATGAEDIFGGKTKYVLGMIWTLILYFQLDSTEDEEELGMSMRSALLEWCNNVLLPQGISVRNFTENWKDGRAFCGLVNALQPNSISLEECTPDKAETNLNLAFNTAHDVFKFPKMLETSEILQYQDELSIITYVSYFRAYLSKYAAYAATTYAEGPGLSEALTFKPAHFSIIACDQDGNRVHRGGAFIRLSLKDTSSNKECGKFVIKDHLDGTYSCTYETEKFGTKGAFELHVKVGNTPIKDSPFHPEIIPGEADPSKCIAFGPGVEYAKAGENTEFTVQAKDLKGDSLTKGGTTIIATLKDRSGDIPVSVIDNNNGTYTCSYATESASEVQLHIIAKTEAFGTGTISGSPYTVKIGPGLANASNTTASGPGTQSATVGVPTAVTVLTHDRYGNKVVEGGAPVSGSLTLDGHSTPLEVVDHGDGTYTLKYLFLKAGLANLEIKVGDTLIKNAPFSVTVEAGAVSIENTEVTLIPHPRAGLPGLTLQTLDDQHNLRRTGGDTVRAECTPSSPVTAFATDNGDGTYAIVYPPHVQGLFRVNVMVNGKNIPKGPWQVEVRENPPDNAAKEKIRKLLPKSAGVVERLLGKITEKEREVILMELGALHK